MDELAGRMRKDLTRAMRARDSSTVRVLRSTLSAVANAEAQPIEASIRLESSGNIAGAAIGVGASEVSRRELTEDDIRNVVASEKNEILDSAAELDRRGATDRATELRAEAAILDRYL